MIFIKIFVTLHLYIITCILYIYTWPVVRHVIYDFLTNSCVSFQTRRNRVRTSVRVGRDRTDRVTAASVRRAKAHRTASPLAFGLCSTKSSCTRCGRATRPTRGRMPSWRSNWSRWPDSARGLYACGSRTKGARTRNAPSPSNSKYNKTKYVHASQCAY